MRAVRALAGAGLAIVSAAGFAQELDPSVEMLLLQGDAQRGRLVFGPCRACHFTEAEAGHGNGPNLSRIFGKVAGKQAGFEYYSPELLAAQFVWTPAVMYAWLESPMASVPGTSMMSAGVPDLGQRADLVAYLQKVSVQEVSDQGSGE
jgi:cytochrome c